MWLSWQVGLAFAAGFGLVSVTARLMLRAGAGPRWRPVGAFAREAALIMVLYAVWQYAGGVSVMQVDGAQRRGRRLVAIQRAWHLPSEVLLQRLILPHPLWVQFANGYYAIMHVPGLIGFLVWAFVRDRDRYAHWRTVMAVSTAVCLVLQLIPVAPPRMLADLGFVDTAHLYQQSVYSALGRGMAGQLAAMPSVHVAWAMIVAMGMRDIAPTSPWRWMGMAHAVMTIVVVSATANHYWADGIVAVALIGVAMVVLWAISSWLPSRTRRARVKGPGTART